MESSRLALIALVLLASLALYTGTRDAGSAGPELLARRLEVARLRAHFDSVDVELRHSNALQLTSAQRAARATLVGWLREYREAGRFPQNDRLPNQAMPFFRDSRGVLCAMAYLIDRSGRSDLVDRVALTRNNAFIPELASDRELGAWLDSTGLSVAEAARIQPMYDYFSTEDDKVSTSYALTSILVSGSSLTTVGLNLISPSRSAAWAGLIAGSAGLVAGAANLDRSGETHDIAAANMIAGGAALVVGLYRLLDPRPAQLVDGQPRQTAGSNARFALSPIVTPTADGSRLGLAVRTSF